MISMEQKIQTPFFPWAIIGIYVIGSLLWPYYWFFEEETPVVVFGGMILSLLLAVGLYKHHNFARIVLILLIFALLTEGIIATTIVFSTLLSFEPIEWNRFTSLIPNFVAIAFNVWLIFFMTSPKMKALFGQNVEQSSPYNRPYFFVGMSIFILTLCYLTISGHIAQNLVPIMLN